MTFWQLEQMFINQWISPHPINIRIIACFRTICSKISSFFDKSNCPNYQNCATENDLYGEQRKQPETSPWPIIFIILKEKENFLKPHLLKEQGRICANFVFWCAVGVLRITYMCSMRVQVQAKKTAHKKFPDMTKKIHSFF